MRSPSSGRRAKSGTWASATSNVEELRRALAVEPVVAVQNRFSLADRSSRPVLELCEANDLAFVAWAPLAKGSLARDEKLRAIASAHGATPGQVALAWILATSPATVPIPGTSSLEHVAENAGAGTVALAPDEIAVLEGATFAMPNRTSRMGAVRRRLRSLVQR